MLVKLYRNLRINSWSLRRGGTGGLSILPQYSLLKATFSLSRNERENNVSQHEAETLILRSKLGPSSQLKKQKLVLYPNEQPSE